MDQSWFQHVSTLGFLEEIRPQRGASRISDFAPVEELQALAAALSGGSFGVLAELQPLETLSSLPHDGGLVWLAKLVQPVCNYNNYSIQNIPNRHVGNYAQFFGRCVSLRSGPSESRQETYHMVFAPRGTPGSNSAARCLESLSVAM